MRENKNEESNIERLRRIREEARKREPEHSRLSGRSRGAGRGQQDELYLGASADDPGKGKSAVVGSFFIDVDGEPGAGGSGRTAGQSRDAVVGRNAGNGRSGGGAQRTRRSRKKSHPLRTLILGLMLALTVFGIWSLGKGRRSGTADPEIPEAKPEIPEKGFYTVAVFGVDSRDGSLGKGALSDVNMIACLNRETGEVRLVSVYRDLYVQIDKEGKYHKFNEAYFRGGPEQALWTMKHNLDIVPDDYATFNWKAVIDAINILGGVDIEITEPEFAYINAFITETVEATGIGSVQLKQAGMNHLDGVQAVAYARLRLMDTDFQRTERQRRVVSLLVEKAKKADPATLMELVTSVMPLTKTSVTIDDLLPMAVKAKKYYLGATGGFPFEKTTGKIDGRDSVIPVTLETNVVQLHKFLFDDDNYKAPESVREVSSRLVKKTGKKADEQAGVKTPEGDGDLGSGSGSRGSSESSGETEKSRETTKAAETTKAKETAASEETTTAKETASSEESSSAEEAAEAEGTVNAADETGNTAASGSGDSTDNTGQGKAAEGSQNASESSESVSEGSDGETRGPGFNPFKSSQSASDPSKDQINRLFGAPTERTTEPESAGPGVGL